jgi:hypothetical protein
MGQGSHLGDRHTLAVAPPASFSRSRSVLLQAGSDLLKLADELSEAHRPLERWRGHRTTEQLALWPQRHRVAPSARTQRLLRQIMGIVALRFQRKAAAL